MKINRKNFGVLSTGEEVYLYTVENEEMSFSVTNFGCVITSIIVPNKNGVKEDIVLGYSNIEGYLNAHGGPYFGAFIGRFANRIAKASFTLNGETYKLDVNDGANTLHGGFRGYDKMLFSAEEVVTAEGAGVRFTRKSPDGEQGFPGNLLVEVTYLLNNKNEISLEYKAWTDKATPVNFTNHTYFNLSGNPYNTVFNHELTLNASAYTEPSADLIPTGKLINVENDKPFDFRKAKEIGKDFAAVKGGYDHNFAIDRAKDTPNDVLTLNAKAYEPTSGRTLTVCSNQPGIQFYAGNALGGSEGKYGQVHKANQGFCLETQAFPDAPNHDNFPSCILNPGEEYDAKTVFAFGW